MKRIAIIGAGLAGITLASELSTRADVTVFDKSRGYGGRMATRRSGDYQFDHGAQYFTARSPGFRKLVQGLMAAGVVSRWDARCVELDRDRLISSEIWDEVEPHYVPVPKMSQLCRHLAEGLDVQLQQEIKSVQVRDRQWELHTVEQNAMGVYDWVIMAIPPIQVIRLMPPCYRHLAAVRGIRVTGCFALMLGFRQSLPLTWDAALIHNSSISWVSVNSSKPGRDGGYSIIALSTNEWAENNLEQGLDRVGEYLACELATVAGVDCGDSEHLQVHRWRYANVERHADTGVLIDTENRLAAVGDWCISGRVESAYTSAQALAEQIGQYI